MIGVQAKYEESGTGAQWDALYDGYGECDNYSLGDAMAMLLFDAVAMLILTWYIETVWPGEFGVPRKWYFFVEKAYWCGSEASSVEEQDAANTSAQADGDLEMSVEMSPLKDSEAFQDAAAGPKGIRILNLTKVYGDEDCVKSVTCGRVDRCEDSATKTMAVNNISIEMAKDEITSLLGHNGAGKTTTMSILCGLYPPTKGTAYVSGYDIRTDMSEIRHNLGICPQYNVLFDRLTVEESLWFCASVKGMDSAKIADDITRFLNDLGIPEKRDVYTTNLSGGMKRKLSVAMAFIGGSDVVILDEPTAGMDPSARRSTWDLLLQYKTGRTIMLSTHHMDEADLLSDRIGIIARGEMECFGTPLYLKGKYGKGYSVIFDMLSGYTPGLLGDLIRKYVPTAKLVHTTDQEQAFMLPNGNRAAFIDLFRKVEQDKERLSINSFGVTAASLEDVFLAIAERSERRHAVEAGDDVVAPAVREQEYAIDSQQIPTYDDDDTSSTAGLNMDSAGVSVSTGLSQASGMYTGTLLTGAALFMSRYRALFMKRFRHALHDRRAMLSQIFLPALFVVFGMMVATAFPPPGNSPCIKLSGTAPLQQVCAVKETKRVEVRIPYVDLGGTAYSHSLARSTPEDFGDSATIQKRGSAARVSSYATFLNTSTEDAFTDPTGSCGAPCSYPNNMSSYLLESHAKEEKFRRTAVSFETAHDPLISLSIGATEQFTLTGRAWYDNRAYHAAPLALTQMNNGIFRANVPGGAGITTWNCPLNRTTEDKIGQYVGSLVDLTTAINVIIAMSFVPASFVLYQVRERVSKSKHLTFVSGAGPNVYWLATFTWDLLNYLLPCIICLVVFYAWDLPAYTGRNFGAVCSLMLMYGWSMTPLMYPANWFFDVPSTAYVVLICTNLFVGLTCTLSTFVLELFQQDDPELYEIGETLKKVFLIFPNYCLGRGLMDIAKNEYLAQYSELAEKVIPGVQAGFNSPFEWEIIGRNLVAMAAQGFGFFVIVVLVERNKHRRPARSASADDAVAEGSGVARGDSDVAAEQDRCRMSNTENTDQLRVSQLCKTYSKSRGQSKKAVDNLSFGVGKGECFGLLGVNGAGKTSTFKMLTGDTRISSGEAYIAGHSVDRERLKARSILTWVELG